jgi:predicted alpha/beta hydrolase family esterase
MKKKTQIFIIHGGMTFENKRNYMNFLRTREVSTKRKVYWTDTYLDENLGKYFEIIRPRMPLQDNAKYEEWKIHFERFIPYIKNNVILIGSSLGGIFLAKYLSENRFPRKILSLYLVCPPFDNTTIRETLAGGFKLKSNLSMINKNSNKIYLLFSKDDDVIPISHAKKYEKRLKNANIIIYKSKNGHFNVSEFPEIVKMIKADIRKK